MVAVRKYSRFCVICGESFDAKDSRYQCCSQACAAKKRGQTKRRPCVVCKQCGKEYHPKEADRDTYCSRECYFASIKSAPKESPLPINCARCGKKFVPIRLDQLCCSDACRLEVSRTRSREYNRQRHGTYQPGTKTCLECGKEFIAIKGAGVRKYCSPFCGHKAYKKTEQGKEQHRNVKARRRAKLAGVELTGVARIEILDRDGWLCGICGGKINRKSQVPDPQAATIDHIIPLALGGPHTASNLQAAHFICNATKSDRGGGQLRLAM